MDGMTQPPMPNGAPQEGGKKKTVLWIVLVVVAIAIIAIWLTMGSAPAPRVNPEVGTPAADAPVPLPPSSDAGLNAIGSDLQNINAGSPATDFQTVDTDVKAL